MTSPAFPAYVYPYAPPAVRRPLGADGVVSIVVLSLSGALMVLGGLFAFFVMAFLDDCPPATCDADTAVGSLMFGGLASFAVMIGGVTWCVVRLHRRSLTWPLALLTGVLPLAGLAVSFAGFFAAV